MPTYSTVPIVLLVMLLWRLTRGNILAILAFTAIFDAASALNFGALGLAPWLLALVLCLPFKIAQGRIHASIAPGIERPAFYLLLAFLLCATFSGFVYPFVFRGIDVVRGADLVPLEWGMPNVAQLCYLAAAAVVFYLAVTSTAEEMATAIVWYIRGCMAATLIAIYQLANAVVHVPYPDALFYSNTAHVVYHAYKINGMWRLNSTFTEASDMAGSLIGGLGILGWQVMTEPLKPARTCWFALMLVVVLMSLSTTGYACLALMMVLGTALYARYIVRSGGIDPAKVAIFLLLLMSATSATVMSHRVRASGSKLISSVVLDKRGSDSYKARAASQVDAMKTLADTYYVGAGLGSTRASGLGYTLLASTGVPGLVLFTMGYLALFVPLFRRRRGRSGYSGDFLLERVLFGLTLLLCGMVLAGSEPNMPMLWMLFGAALITPPSSLAARVRRETGKVRPHLPSSGEYLPLR